MLVDSQSRLRQGATERVEKRPDITSRTPMHPPTLTGGLAPEGASWSCARSQCVEAILVSSVTTLGDV